MAKALDSAGKTHRCNAAQQVATQRSGGSLAATPNTEGQAVQKGNGGVAKAGTLSAEQMPPASAAASARPDEPVARSRALSTFNSASTAARAEARLDSA